MKNVAIILIIVLFPATLSAQQYPITNPNFIKVLYEYPETYTVLNFIDISREIGFSRKKAKERALRKAKKKASKIGANAILLQGYDRSETIISSHMNVSIVALYIPMPGNANNKPLNVQNNNIPANTKSNSTNPAYENYISTIAAQNDVIVVGDTVVIKDEGRQCVGVVLDIKGKNTAVVEFYHERSGKIQKVKRSFSEIANYKKKQY